MIITIESLAELEKKVICEIMFKPTIHSSNSFLVYFLIIILKNRKTLFKSQPDIAL